jgi:Ca-activated chloride channel homolog
LAALQDARFARTSAEKVMILMTDGQENIGRALNAAYDCAAAKVIVHTITFSENANQATMREVAQVGGGRHYHATDAESLRAVFRELAAQTPRLTE